MAYLHAVFGDDGADDGGIKAPFVEDIEHFLLTTRVRDQQHAFLRLAQHDFITGHAAVALRHAIQLNLKTYAATTAHLAGTAGEARCSHVLDAADRARFHCFQAGFEQQLLEERISHLHVGPLLFTAFGELLRRHGCAMDAVAARLGSHVDHGIADAGRLGIEDLVVPHQAQREGIQQRIAAVAGFKARFATEIRHSKAVAIASDAVDDTFHDAAVLLVVDGERRGCIVVQIRHAFRRGQAERAETQRVHHGHGTRTHGEDVPQNTADAGCRTLVWLNVAGVVVALDLEGAGPAVAHVNDAGVLARALHDGTGTALAKAFGGQSLQVDAAALIAAVFAPHNAVDAQLCERGRATHGGEDLRVLLICNVVQLEEFRGDDAGLRHVARRGRDLRLWRDGCGLAHKTSFACMTQSRQRVVRDSGATHVEDVSGASSPAEHFCTAKDALLQSRREEPVHHRHVIAACLVQLLQDVRGQREVQRR